MITKEQAREEIKALVEKYNKIIESGKAKSYNEEMTKKDFILPLFRALGWSVEDSDEVTAEEKISKGRVDYAFRIEGIPKLFLEAKAIREDLDRKEFAEQAINYAWHKGATWALLTDFEGIKVFNAEWKSVNYLQNQFFSINCNRFLDNFEQLWLLSKESLGLGLIDKEAEKWGKKAKKIPVDKQLLSDLTRFRELLTKNILKNNSSKNLTEEDLEEAVQRIIDRLIFIRTLEDKQLEAPVLQSLIRENTNKIISKKLNDVFRKIDDVYNSKLFTPHLCEELIIDNDILEKIIYGLFKTADNTVHYDFSAIDADVLGNIYEQYLGHVLKKTAKRASLTEEKSYRKEQGIYYTPTYVVDYIVKNTIGELAKNKRFDLKNIKVLDPACGSGSFLMKAFDYLVTLDKKKNGDTSQTKLDLTGASASYGRKVEILKENIFGVDLDSKAVEIAQLNLLLKTAEKKHRLPMLQENIKVGNSLIDDPAIAGDKAFKWEDEFKDVMKDGGFDVVIGNPPYGALFNKNEKNYFGIKYSYVKSVYESYRLFIEKATRLVNKNGYMGLIIPNTWFYLTNAEHMRKELLSKFSITKIINLSQNVFEDATVDTCIIILKNNIPPNNKISVYFFPYKKKINNLEGIKYSIVKQHDLFDTPLSVINLKLTVEDLSLIKKIETQPFILNNFVKIITGIKPYQVGKGIPPQTRKIVDEKPFTSVEKTDSTFKSWLTGKCINRYCMFPNKEFIKYGEWLAEPKTADIFESNRIVVQQIRNPSLPRRIIATFLKGGIYTNNGIHNLLVKNKDQSYWVLGILNSKMMNFYFSAHYNDLNIKPSNLYNLPYPKYESKSQLSEFVAQILKLNKRLIELKDKQTDEKTRLEKEIQKTDNEIDQEVYKIYGITKEEQKIIEGV